MILFGGIKADPDGYAILANYEIEESRYNSKLDEMLTERTPGLKRIKIKTLNESSSVSEMAASIVSKCKYIQSSNVRAVEKVLLDLLKRKLKSTISIRETAAKEDQGRPVEYVTMDELDDYIENLYSDDIESKVDGSIRIHQLSQTALNLESLSQNEALMMLLSRVLSEDFKKSFDLSYNMIQIFLNFSNFATLHDTISNYRIGAITMKIIDFEIKRHHLRVVDAENSLADDASEREIEKSNRKMRDAMRKQDKLMFVCFYVLYNIAEDLHTERRMVKRKVVQCLAEILDRNSTSVLILAVHFLKKLSVFEGNKDTMLETHVIEKLVPYIPSNSDKLIQAILRLFFNLSFDSGAREIMVKNSLIPKLVDLLKRAPFRALSLRILYHLSIEDRCKSMFTYTEAIPIIRQLVVHFPQNMVAKELVALAINLTHKSRNAELMCQGSGSLKQLVERVLRTRDPLLMKVIRNLSQWTFSIQEELSKGRPYKYSGMWGDYIKPLLRLSQESENHDLLVETLGVLSNITPLDLPSQVSWPKLISKYSLLQYFHKLLVPGFSQDDIVLEVINCIATLALDPECATVLSSSQLIQELHKHLREKKEDHDIALQILYCFQRMLGFPELLEELLYGSAVLSEVLCIASSPNTEVRRMCDEVMDVILDHDMAEGEMGQFGIQIRRRRFAIHNEEFLEIPFDMSCKMDDISEAGQTYREGCHRYDIDLDLSQSEDFFE